MPSRSVINLSELLYPNYQSESDRLDSAVRNNIVAGAQVLDLGCGSGKLYPHSYRSQANRVVGVDLDWSIRENVNVDDRVFATADALPFKPQTFDVIYSRYVLEHLEKPQRVFDEVARLLRPSGRFIVLTPNLYHYVAALSRLTPAPFHKAFNKRVRGRSSDDTFPTRYRANTLGALRSLASNAGLEEQSVDMIETRPNYLMWSAPSFLLGALYERFVNSTNALKQLRVNILAIFRKSESRQATERHQSESQ
jgi:SAM-dependent methyltransferase